MFKFPATFLIFALSVASAVGTVRHVPGQYPTIAGAVREATAGDTVLLARGVHTQTSVLDVNKRLVIASNFLIGGREADIDSTVVTATSSLAEWFMISSAGIQTKIIGLRFQGNKNHSVSVQNSNTEVIHCKFYGGNDQLSFEGKSSSPAGGYAGYCTFEGSGDDGIDCDNTTNWTVEHCTFVNSHQDAIEVRLQPKSGSTTRHIFRHNTIVHPGESGLQMIDYPGDSRREIIIYGNVFKNCGGAGVSCMYNATTNEDYQGSDMVENSVVYNNTFDGCNYGITESPNLVILNNLFTNCKTRGIERGKYTNSGNDKSIVDYCNFYNNPADYDEDINKGSNLCAWNPQYANTTSYELSSASPCIDKGTASYEWNGKTVLNISNADYQGAAPDLGAKEYGSSGQTANAAPLVDAGPDAVVVLPAQTANLNGSVTDDGNPAGTLTSRWMKESGPGTVAFGDTSKPATSATFSQQGLYILQLTGDDGEKKMVDRATVHYVKDFADRSAQAGKEDVFLEAEDYRYLAGSAEMITNAQASGDRAVQSSGPYAYTEYLIRTNLAATYQVWVRITGNSPAGNDVSVAFNDMDAEQILSGPTDGNLGHDSWRKATFAGVPEGVYPLRIRSAETGVIWDRLFVTTNPDSHPEDASTGLFRGTHLVKFAVSQNYPNPFNLSTKIAYTLSGNDHVVLKIYTIAGREIQTLIREYQNGGAHEIDWNGDRLPGGVYLFSFKAGDYTDIKKMVLAK